MKRSLAHLALLLPIALMLAMNALWSPVWYDDAGHWLVAREAAEGGDICYPINSETGECDPASQYISMGPLLTYPAAQVMALTGAGVFGIRWMMVILTLAMLLAFGWLVAQSTERTKAWWAIALMGGNIQLLTYGAQFLGETPMLLFLLLGMGFLVRQVKTRHWGDALGAAVCLVGAGLVKESILPMLALGLGSWFVVNLLRRRWTLALWSLAQAGLPVAFIAGWHWIHLGSWDALSQFMEARSSYAGEFLSFDWRVSLSFLALKPIIWLGLVAILIKVRVKRQPVDTLLLCLFMAQLVLFIAGAGYDRHGFQLIFIPAIYLAEFALFGWKWMTQLRKLSWLVKVAYALLIALFSLQQTPLLLAGRYADRAEMNAPEKWVVSTLQVHQVKRVFTYDQQLIPFLPKAIGFRLEPKVPHAAAGCKPMVLQEGEVFVAGMYARDIFTRCVPWDDLEVVETSPEKDYVIYQLKQRHYASLPLE